MWQLNIDRAPDGTFCYEVWECEWDDEAERVKPHVVRAAGAGMHSLREAAKAGTAMLLRLGLKRKYQEPTILPFESYRFGE